MRTIGELSRQGESPLVKMWTIGVSRGRRPFVRHSHTQFEIAAVNEGEGEYTTENAVYPMMPGDVFVFSSNEVHYITGVDRELSITNLQFEPRFLIESGTERYGLNFCFFHSPGFKNRIPAAAAAVQQEYHRGIREELLKRETGYADAIKAYLKLMAIDLVRRHDYQTNDPGHNGGAIFDMASVYNYIEDHFSEEIRLKDVAEIAALSPNYFSHAFKKLNGISLWEYITAKRVEKAARLIAEQKNAATLLEIATQCGFNNTVNFNKAFKRQKGITPGELKKNTKLLSD